MKNAPMKIAMIIVALVCIGLAIEAVSAAPPMNTGLSWSNATQYTDGSSMPLSDIEFNTLYCGVFAGQYQMQQNYPADPPNLTKEQIFADLNLTYDVDYFCVMTHTANGKESGNSNEVNFIVPDARTPGSPTLTVE